MPSIVETLPFTSTHCAPVSDGMSEKVSGTANLSERAAALLDLLDDFRRRYVTVQPSQAWLAGKLGVGLRTVSRLVAELKRAGLLLVVPRVRDGRQVGAMYQLMVESWEVVKYCAAAASDACGVHSKNFSKTNTSNKIQTPPATFPQAVLAAPLTASDLSDAGTLRGVAETALAASGKPAGALFGCWQWLARLSATARRVAKRNGRGDGLAVFRWLLRERCDWHTDADAAEARLMLEPPRPKPKPIPQVGPIRFRKEPETPDGLGLVFAGVLARLGAK